MTIYFDGGSKIAMMRHLVTAMTSQLIGMCTKSTTEVIRAKLTRQPYLVEPMQMKRQSSHSSSTRGAG